MCCWSGDRQYADNNGDCSLGHCINRDPGDNTDLCWSMDGADVFPYPNPTEDRAHERDLHCHGLSWHSEDVDFRDTLDANHVVNKQAKWNNLYFVSLYDHLYQRGYVNTITEARDFEGADDMPMCGCVEDMPLAVARADCTEARGSGNYTFYQDQDTGRLKLDYIEGTFKIEYRACRGWEYKADVTPEAYQEPGKSEHQHNLRQKTNDLSAHIFRQYLEGRTTEQHTKEYEKVVVGYKHPEVNKNDDEREKVCKQKFEAEYPGKSWELVVVEEDEVTPV